MSLPSILVIDDQYGQDPAERMLFQKKAGLGDCKFEGGNSDKNGLIASAEFCSGQVNDGDRITNDYTVVADAVRQRGESNWSLVLLDVRFDSGCRTASGLSGTDQDEHFGEDIRDRLAQDFPNLPVVMLSGKREVELTDHSAPYISKHEFDRREMTATLLEFGRLTSEQSQALLGLESNLVLSSTATRKVYALALRFAANDNPTLILGESGTGKESLAHVIHYHSKRADKPFIPINSTAIPENLLESELFGYERGAFTGAHAAKQGKFELADTGTLFLDEIGDMSMSLQPKILRVLEDGQVMRIGGIEPKQVDVRIITATNCDLKQRIEGKQFREDLYHRLNVNVIYVPPLRDRREEIPDLAQRFLDRESQAQNKAGIELSDDALNYLCERDYPGNIRELENLIKSVVGRAGHNQHLMAQTFDNLDDGVTTYIGSKEKTAIQPEPPLNDNSLADFLKLFGTTEIAADASDLKGILPRLEGAYADFRASIVGAALDLTRHPISGKFNQKAVAALLYSDPSVDTKAARRFLNKVLGRTGEKPLSQQELQALVEGWKNKE